MRLLPWPACAQAIIAQLKDEGDEMAQLAGLTELCEYLSISTEESLMAFPTEQVVPLLVGDGEKGGEEGRGVVGSRSKSCSCWWVVEGGLVGCGSKPCRC